MDDQVQTITYDGVDHDFPMSFSQQDIARALKAYHVAPTNAPPPPASGVGSIAPNGDTVANEPHGLIQQVGDSLSNTWEGLKHLGSVPMDEGKAAIAAYQQGNYARALMHAGNATFPGPAMAYQLGSNALAAQGHQGDLMQQAASQGNNTEAVMRGVAAGVPVVGPMAADMYDKTQAGRGAEAATDLATQAFFGKLLEGGTSSPIVKNLNNPVSEAALQELENSGIPMTAGQRQGNTAVQRIEQQIPTSNAQRFYNDQQAALGQEMQSRVNTLSPTQTNEYGAGQGIQDRLAKTINAGKAEADQRYDSVRQQVAANPQSVQTGMTAGQGPQPTGVLDAQGNPVMSAAVPGQPIMSTMNSPVDLQPFQQSMRPIWDEINATMPEGKKLYSGAYTSLKDIMDRDMADGTNRYIDPMAFDKKLGALKALTRDGGSSLLSNQTQGLAKQLIGNGEQGLEQGLGPQSYQMLQFARRKVTDYYATQHQLSDLPSEPAAAYSQLTRGGDKVVDQLRTLQQVAPKEVQTMGRTYLQGLVDKATKDGGFDRTAGVTADWNRMGPETKTLLFGKDFSADMDKFLLGAKKVRTDYNPSGTAKAVAALGPLAGVAGAAYETITGNPGAGAAIAGGVAGTHALSSVLFTPGGIKALTSAIKLRPGTPEFANAMAGINAMVKANQAKEDTQNNLQGALNGANAK